MSGDVQEAFTAGAHQVALAVAAFVPRVLAMLLVLAFTLAIAFVVRWAFRRLLSGVDFNRRVHRWGLTSTGEWTPTRSPTQVAAHAAFWFVALVGFLAGLKALDTPVTDTLSAGALAFIPDMLAALLIFAVGIMVARFLARAVLVNAVNMKIQSARLLSTGVKWLVVIFSIALALQQLRIGGAVLTVSFAVVFGGIVLALALGVGLGSRKVVSRELEQRWHQSEEAGHEETEDAIHHM